LLYPGPPAERQAQHSLKRPIHCRGVGVHSGARVRMRLVPAPADHGIRFRRTDLPKGPDGTANEIPASPEAVVDTTLCTVLGNQRGARVSTVEHVMAALSGLGVDNAVVEIDGPEVPILDGSAEPLVFLIDRAGRIAQGRPRRTLRLLEPVEVADGRSRARLLPASQARLDVEIDFDSPAIGRQRLDLALTPESFRRELAPARTFGFAEEVAELHARGLARGGNLDNAVVIEAGRVANAEGLRCTQEFVRHKALDAVGDLALLGVPVIARFEGRRCGHSLTVALVQALRARPEAWILTDPAQSAVTEASFVPRQMAPVPESELAASA